MTAHTEGDDPRLDDLLLRWEELHDQGQSVSAEELCSTCPELAEELDRRIASFRRLRDLLDGTTTVDSKPSEPVTAGAASRQSATARADFRDLRFHAAGALGEVFLARNAELNREVALKFLKPDRVRDADSRRRFLQEAEVTGRLEHPGVVPIYALGTDATGSPCYAMRFIRGETLQDAIDAFHAAERPGRDPTERSLALRDLLNRFVSICSTIGYAHSRGILHRDLKPRNVMLGKYDETLVVDWGLAKPFERGEAARSVGEETLTPGSGSGEDGSDTPTVGVVGTPAYMSPEQAEARWDLVGPASDLFSLGSILYSMLTGKAPYQAKKVAEILDKVKRCEFRAPRQVKPEVSRALEAICLKAMARRPEDRYGSAPELASDVRRWLADEPVTVYREPVAARARRWMRRHRTLVTSAMAAMVAGLIGLAAVAAVQNQSNRELKAANEGTTRALAAETRAKEENEKALADSEEARKRAEAVLGFLKDDVLAVARPEGQEGGLGVDVTVRKAVDAAEARIAAAFKDQPFVEADVRDTLGMTYLFLREARLATRQLERALALREEKLGHDHPQTLQSRNNLAAAYHAAGRFDDAIRLLEATVRGREEKLGPAHPDTLTSRSDLAVTYGNAGRIADAVRVLEETLRLREEQLGPDHPDTLFSRSNLAAAYQAAGRVADAIRLDEETLRGREEKLGPDHPDTLQSRSNLAAAYVKAGRIGDAIRLHDATLRGREAKLGPKHPDTLSSRSNLAAAYHAAGRIGDAIRLDEETLRLRGEKLGADHPDTLQSRNNLAVGYGKAGRIDDAIRLLEETLRLREGKLGADHPDTLQSRNNLAVGYEKAGRVDDAIRLHEGTLRLWEEKLGADHPDTLHNRSNLAGAYEAARRWADAESLRRDVLARRRKYERADSPLLAGELALLGHNLLKQAKWSEAEAALRDCLAIREKATPDEWLRFNTMSLLGAARLGQDRHAEAEPLIVGAYEGMKAREAKIPAAGRPRLSEAAERVIRLYETWGQHEKAAAWKIKLGSVNLPSDVFASP